MAAILTDQMRVLNAKNFLSEISNTQKSHYIFLGLTNPTDYNENWNSNPPAPRDNFDNEHAFWDSMISLKKITSDNAILAIPKRTWSSGSKYDMYRHDYSIDNLAPVSGSPTLYGSFFHVVNSDNRVYICLQNGTNPDNQLGKPSLDEPTFTDLEPRSAGSSGDGYIWKYLYTLNSNDIIKFDSTQFTPLPLDWSTSVSNALVRDNAVDGSIKIVVVSDSGTSVGEADTQYTNVPIKGDGIGAECTIIVNEDSQVSSVQVSNQGSGYTYGYVDTVAGGVPLGATPPKFDVIISPKGGHGHDIYRELGALNVLLYNRIENDFNNPDFITGNDFARIGIVESPFNYDSDTILIKEKASAVGALKLTGVGYSASEFTPNSLVKQTVSTGTTAVGKVVSYDQTTGVLKYWQDRTLVGFNTDGSQNSNPVHGFDLTKFTSDPDAGGNINIVPNVGEILQIDANFSGETTSINNRTYYFGLNFIDGLANPEVKKYSGNIIYVDNRPSITRSSTQKEDIKIILQF